MREGRTFSPVHREQGVKGCKGGGEADSAFTNQTPMATLRSPLSKPVGEDRHEPRLLHPQRRQNFLEIPTREGALTVRDSQHTTTESLG